MDKIAIVGQLAQERRVETMVENIAKQPLTADLKDLVQMVYLILLEYDEEKIIDLWENGQINFFIARIILNQYRSSNSPFHKLFRKYAATQDYHIYSAQERLDHHRDCVDIPGFYIAD